MISLQALYRVLHLHLQSLCDGKVYPDLAPAQDTPRPYIVFAYLPGGGNADRRRKRNETLTLEVCMVADSLAEAFAGAEQIETLLVDHGSQLASPLPAHTDWDITTVRQDQLVHLVEVWNGQPMYKTGHHYIFTLEAR